MNLLTKNQKVESFILYKIFDIYNKNKRTLLLSVFKIKLIRLYILVISRYLEWSLSLLEQLAVDLIQASGDTVCLG